MDIKRLKDKKKELGFTNQRISEISGVPLGTVQKIFGSTTKEPRRETYLALLRALDPMAEYADQSQGTRVGESVAAYALDGSVKRQGEYTVDDYYALPDDRRVELIDGVIYDMTSPTIRHQAITGEVYFQLVQCAEEHDLDCFPAISPIDVQLDKDNKTMVQPDVIVICDMSTLRERVVYGAPEFVVEVLSPTTRKKDQFIKLNKYCNAGCREVWIVDPEKSTVWTYDFSRDDWPETYSFDDVVPVAISEGKCAVDFSRVKGKLDRVKAMIREE